ncbi:DUF262 domain-containing protein [Bacillus sp. C1-1]|nr:DUF262 domain-containing protein [Bacillus sp. C1-1]
MSYEQLSLDLNQLTTTDLLNEIRSGRAEIKTDEIDITISELVNMYSNREVLDIHPEFQRLFRWSSSQKSKLIESILLGIPIPPLFVAEDDTSAWDVIDGVQRLSTIFEFLGVLKDDQNELVEPSYLVGTEKLPALEGKVWDNSVIGQEHRFSFGDGVGLQNKFLYSKLKLIRVSNDSNPNAKYDIFDRLNTGGSKLRPQEIRNCLAIMVNRDFYTWMRKLSQELDFQDSIPFSEKGLNEQVDLEYVLRFITYRHISRHQLGSNEDIHDVLTRELRRYCLSDEVNLDKEEEVFKKTFRLLSESLGENSIKKFHSDEERFKGQPMLSSFEIVAIGVANNIDYISNLPNPQAFIAEKVKNLYDSKEYIDAQNRKIISGRAVTRFLYLTKLGTEYFSK